MNLYSRIERMALLEPAFIDMTWGAGGSTADLTLELSGNAQNFCNLEVMMHLTCTNLPKDEVYRALLAAKEAGIRNILALRGGMFHISLLLMYCNSDHKYAHQTLPVVPRHGSSVRMALLTPSTWFVIFVRNLAIISAYVWLDILKVIWRMMTQN